LTFTKINQRLALGILLDIFRLWKHHNRQAKQNLS